MLTKMCRRCGVEKPITEFYKHNHTKDDYRNECKECHSKKGKEYYKREGSKERHRVSARKYTLKQYGLDEASYKALGKLDDNPDTVLNAYKYLKGELK